MYICKQIVFDTIYLIGKTPGPFSKILDQKESFSRFSRTPFHFPAAGHPEFNFFLTGKGLTPLRKSFADGPLVLSGLLWLSLIHSLYYFMLLTYLFIL